MQYLKYFWCFVSPHSGPEYLKKSRPKKLVKSNKSISWHFILAKFHFLKFQKWPKINFWTRENAQNCQKCNFTKTFLIYFISRVFLGPDFFKFSAPLWAMYECTCTLWQTLWPPHNRFEFPAIIMDIYYGWQDFIKKVD